MTHHSVGWSVCVQAHHSFLWCELQSYSDTCWPGMNTTTVLIMFVYLCTTVTLSYELKLFLKPKEKLFILWYLYCDQSKEHLCRKSLDYSFYQYINQKLQSTASKNNFLTWIHINIVYLLILPTLMIIHSYIPPPPPIYQSSLHYSAFFPVPALIQSQELVANH